jgi:hypothetical protein
MDGKTGGVQPLAGQLADYRRFSPRIEAVAADWHAEPIQRVRVEMRTDFSATADGVRTVEITSGIATGLTGYVKPKPAKEDRRTAAREKLASDLARELGLPVAPVVIRPPMQDLQYFTSMSLGVFEGARVLGDMATAHRPEIAPLLEAMRPFWTWIGDEDHNRHFENALYMIRGGKAHLVAIDHSYAFNHREGDSLTIPPCTGYDTVSLPGCDAARDEILRRIEEIDWSTIKVIVNRLSVVLSPQEQENILSLLERRRTELRSLVGP